MSHNDGSRKRPRLSKLDALTLLDITVKCLQCSTESDYKQIFELLNTILPFDQSTSGLAKLDPEGMVVSYELANINYPVEWLQTYKEKNFSGIDVIVKRNFTSFTPQFWDHTYKAQKPAREFITLASDFNLIHGYTYGARPFGFCKQASLFSFSGNFKKYDPTIIAILETIVPHLHLASSRIIEARLIQHNRKILSGREREVLSWLKHGKSSWDISAILQISECTVNYHIYNIIKKLDVQNRPQAVAVATHLGILDPD
jgi:DNA-binding CsgD family transcriptional regulator